MKVLLWAAAPDARQVWIAMIVVSKVSKNRQQR